MVDIMTFWSRRNRESFSLHGQNWRKQISELSPLFENKSRVRICDEYAWLLKTKFMLTLIGINSLYSFFLYILFSYIDIHIYTYASCAGSLLLVIWVRIRAGFIRSTATLTVFHRCLIGSWVYPFQELRKVHFKDCKVWWTISFRGRKHVPRQTILCAGRWLPGTDWIPDVFCSLECIASDETKTSPGSWMAFP